GARVRLDVGVVGPEERAGAISRELLGVVDHIVAAVVALPRITLGVLVREHGSLRGEDRERGEVLRRDELDRGVLSLDLSPDDLGELWISGRQGSERVRHLLPL